MPLAPAYDKMIDSPAADMKNIGGRNAGSITAAQFLQRFVQRGTPGRTSISPAWPGRKKTRRRRQRGDGLYGMRLLDQLVAANYEDK